MFPTDWPTKADATDGSAMVRVRVVVNGKGVARRGATLWADDLPAAHVCERVDDDWASTPVLPEEPVTDTIVECTGEAVPDQSAQPTQQLVAVDSVALGHVTSEVPRGAARGAAASALCSSAALQDLRWAEAGYKR